MADLLLSIARTFALVVLPLAVGVSSLSGCDDSSDREDKAFELSATCALDSDCEEPYVCAFERCHEECGENRDCLDGALCVHSDAEGAAVCQLEDETSCENDKDCAGEQLCGEDGQCRDTCEATSECPADLVCAPGLALCAGEDEDIASEMPDAGDGAPSEDDDVGDDDVADDDVEEVDAGDDDDVGDDDVGDDDVPEPVEGTVTFTAEGGTYSASGIEFDVPADAVAEDTVIRVETVDEAPVPLPAEWTALGDIYSVTPHDQEFAQPVTLRIPYDSTIENPALAWLDDDTAEWETVTADFDSEPGLAVVERDGLSYYVVVDLGEEVPSEVSWIECGDRVTDDATEVAADVAADTTWSGKVYVTRGINVTSQAVLTIEPGTMVVMKADSYLNVLTDSTLVAEGTTAAPITFCGERDEAGSWRTLSIAADAAADSSLRNVLVSDGGSVTAGLVLGRELPVEDVQVRNSGTAGVQAAGFDEGSTRLSVEGSVGVAAMLTGPSALTRFPLGGILSGNGDDLVTVAFNNYYGDSAVDTDAIFHNIGVPYLVQEWFSVVEAATLTIEPGVELQWAQGIGLNVGEDGAPATLIADGTPELPIGFRGEVSEPGYWSRVLVTAATPESVLRNVVIDGGGADGMAVELHSGITVENVTVSNSGADGVHAFDFKDGSSQLTVTGCAGVPAFLTDGGAVTRFPLGGSVSGNGDDRVAIGFDNYYGDSGVDVDTVFHDLGVPYSMLEWFNVTNAATLTVEPGVEMEWAQDTGLSIGSSDEAATIVMDGTAELPIALRGAVSDPGYWSALVVGTAVTPDSVLRNVTIDGGGSDGMGLQLEKGITVDEVVVTNSGADGVHAFDFKPGSQNLSVTGSVGAVALLTNASAVDHFPLGGELTGNGDDSVALNFNDGGSGDSAFKTDTAVHDLGVTYLAQAQLTVFEGATLTIEEGVEIQFATNTEVVVKLGAGLVAVGSAADPIVFSGSNPVAGWWNGIFVADNLLAGAALDHVEIHHAINGVDVTGVIAITNCLFADLEGCGVLDRVGDGSAYLPGNTFTNVASNVCEP